MQIFSLPEVSSISNCLTYSKLVMLLLQHKVVIKLLALTHLYAEYHLIFLRYRNNVTLLPNT
jgi:hypothetical protein